MILPRSWPLGFATCESCQFASRVNNVADEIVIRVPADFEKEFPGASRSAAEVWANVVRTSDVLLAEFGRRRREIADLDSW